MPDAPDWVETVAVTVIVENEPVIPTVKNEHLIIEIDRLTTSSTEYQDVVSWTVTEGRIGELQFIEFESDNYDKTNFRLEVGGEEIFTDLQIQQTLTIEVPLVKLAADVEVLLQAKSTDGTEITVDGDIIGKEIG